MYLTTALPVITTASLWLLSRLLTRPLLSMARALQLMIARQMSSWMMTAAACDLAARADTDHVADGTCMRAPAAVQRTDDNRVRLAPRPGWALPIIGDMARLGHHSNPYQCMSELSERLGSVFALKMGSTDALVTSDFQSIREVLVLKGDHFDARPNFTRYNELFGGDRDNSLALCDWSSKQRSRRNVARHFMHVRNASDAFFKLNEAITDELPALEHALLNAAGQAVNFKKLIQENTANIFCKYLCSRNFSYNDPYFQHIVRNFDEIFWDINLGYAMDFIDWLKVFRLNLLGNLRRLAQEIREFISERILEPHKQLVNHDNPRDFVDMLLIRMKQDQNGNERIDEMTALYELEDFIGGSSAVGNIIMQALTQLALNPDAQQQAQQQIDAELAGEPVSIEDRARLPYIEAVLYETLRVTSSPIVPHVASRDSSVAGYHVSRGTVVFINNYQLNMSEQYWHEPLIFRPGRFVRDGLVHKPTHFLPFSTGKRSCMGSKMLTHVAIMSLACVLAKFHVQLPPSAADRALVTQHLVSGRLALPVDTYPLVFQPRAAS